MHCSARRLSDDNIVTGSLKLKSGIKKKKKKEAKKSDPIDENIVQEETVIKKTPTQLAFEEINRKRVEENILKKGLKSHKQKVEEFNKYLSELSEHHDIPKVGPGFFRISALAVETQMLELQKEIHVSDANQIWQLSWNHAGTQFASCSGDKVIRIYGSVATELKYKIENAHSRTIRSIAYSPDDKFLAVASFDGKCSIWTVSRNEWVCVSTLEGHENEVKSISWSASGTLLATCGRDKTVWIWQIEDDNDVECLAVLQEHSQDVKMVKWHPFDEVLASCGYDNSIKIFKDWDDEWICTATLTGHESTVWAIDFNEQGNQIVSCSDDRTIRIWSLCNLSSYNFNCIQIIPDCHSRPIYSVSWSGNNNLIASAGGDNSICIFETSSESSSFALKQKIENAHLADVNDVKWNPKTNRLISCGDDDSVKLWQWE